VPRAAGEGPRELCELALDGKRESAREADTQPLARNSWCKEAEERPGLRLSDDSIHLTLLVRAYCHLCDDMRAEVTPLADAAGVRIIEIDVDADPSVEARFGDLVPVLLLGSIDGVELCRYRLDPARVAGALHDAM